MALGSRQMVRFAFFAAKKRDSAISSCLDDQDGRPGRSGSRLQPDDRGHPRDLSLRQEGALERPGVQIRALGPRCTPHQRYLRVTSLSENTVNFGISMTFGSDFQIHRPAGESVTRWLMAPESYGTDASASIPASWSTQLRDRACSERPHFALRH